MIDEARFRRYVAHFNAGDYDRVAEFYADDVELAFPDGRTVTGRDGIVAFYRPIHRAVHELLDIRFLLTGADRVAAELYTEFRCVQDMPTFPGRPLAAGDVLRLTSFVHYDVADDRFRAIRVARYRTHEEVAR